MTTGEEKRKQNELVSSWRLYRRSSAYDKRRCGEERDENRPVLAEPLGGDIAQKENRPHAEHDGKARREQSPLGFAPISHGGSRSRSSPVYAASSSEEQPSEEELVWDEEKEQPAEVWDRR